jgi:acetoin utilization deacetylase AcuC-like enzyme
MDTAVSEKSFEAAIHAVTATIMASKTNDFALVRPPGHHSHPSSSGGFCIFNNIALAAKKLVDEGKKVFILDFDGHLGDGTEKFFYNSNKVLYWSLHQSPAFPGGGAIDEIGGGEGKSYTINVPMPPGSGDDILLKSINRFIPLAKKFKPDVVGVSAGFDGHHADPLLSLNFSMNAYYEIGKTLRQNFKNIFATLEGGYNTNFLPKCIHNFIAGINGEDIKFKEESTKSDAEIIKVHEEILDKLERNLVI